MLIWLMEALADGGECVLPPLMESRAEAEIPPLYHVLILQVATHFLILSWVPLHFCNVFPHLGYFITLYCSKVTMNGYEYCFSTC